MSVKKQPRQINYKPIFWGMLIGASISLLASMVLSIDAIKLAENPNARLSCSINEVLNCATVNSHPSAHLFGFPNSFLGLMAESVVITVSVAGLMGVAFPKKFMFAAQIGYSLGLIFALYLLYTSYFVIGALCPWCLAVTLTTILVWFSMTRYNILKDNLFLPKHVNQKLKNFVNKDYDIFMMLTIVVLIVAAIFVKYGSELFA